MSFPVNPSAGSLDISHIPEKLAQDRVRIETWLEGCDWPDGVLGEAVRYALLGAGKRMRAHLVYTTSRLYNLDLTLADYGAAAIESIHAYSLAHDDLPAMDDDDQRRGKPTVHKKWNEATAILVGDYLQARGFEFLSQVSLPPARVLDLIQSLAQAAQGMVVGQDLDLRAEKSCEQMDLAGIKNLQNRKTGDLIVWAAQFAPRALGLDPGLMGAYAQGLGLAFQIQDDILDVLADSATLGKTAGKDQQAGKATFVSLLGLDGARKAAQEAIDTALSVLDDFDQNADDLRVLARFVIKREK